MAHWGNIDRGLAEKPELVFALAAAVGTPLEPIQDAIRKELEERGYTSETVRLSSILADCVELGLPAPTQPCSELERLVRLMDLGDRLRQLWSLGDALALLAIARIAESHGGRKPQPGRAYVIRQLKHLMSQGMSQDEAQMLIERDAGGGQPYAQQLRETFCMGDAGDAFVRIMQDDVDALGNAISKLVGTLGWRSLKA